MYRCSCLLSWLQKWKSHQSNQWTVRNRSCIPSIFILDLRYCRGLMQGTCPGYGWENGQSLLNRVRFWGDGGCYQAVSSIFLTKKDQQTPPSQYHRPWWFLSRQHPRCFECLRGFLPGKPPYTPLLMKNVHPHFFM